MSSGNYNFNPKVLHPHENFLQMTSDTQLTPFYFGGSQVPLYVHNAHGTGMSHPHTSEYKFTLQDQNHMTPQKRGTVVTNNKYNRIMMPKMLAGIMK